MREEQAIDLPVAFDEVWEAARLALEKAGWKFTTDKSKGRYGAIVNLRLGLSDIVPHPETLLIDLTRIDSNTTRVKVGIGVRRLHWGTTRSHVDSFLSELRKKLEGKSGSSEVEG